MSGRTQYEYVAFDGRPGQWIFTFAVGEVVEYHRECLAAKWKAGDAFRADRAHAAHDKVREMAMQAPGSEIYDLSPGAIRRACHSV